MHWPGFSSKWFLTDGAPVGNLTMWNLPWDRVQAARLALPFGPIETRTGLADLRWFWTLHAPSKLGSMQTSNRVATLEVGQGRVGGELKAVL